MQCWTVGLAPLPPSASQRRPAAPGRDPDFWLAISYPALLCTVCAFAIQNYALRRSDQPRRPADGQRTGVRRLFAWLWLGEAMGPLRWLGGGLMAVAAVMATGEGVGWEKEVGEKKEIRFVKPLRYIYARLAALAMDECLCHSRLGLVLAGETTTQTMRSRRSPSCGKPVFPKGWSALMPWGCQRDIAAQIHQQEVITCWRSTGNPRAAKGS